MDKIKFRVYTKLGGEFHYFDDITFYPNSPRNRLLFHNYYPMKLDNSDCKLRSENYIIQQFTTLFDINKQEIYNGDIISQTKVISFYRPQEIEETLYIGWSNKECGWRAFTNPKCIGGGFKIKEDCKVIGNIFEKPLDKDDKVE